MTKIGFVFALVLALVVPELAHTRSAGEGAYRTGDYPRAARKIVPAAERGDARAQAYLGFMYQYGRGVPQSYRLAIYWYRRGAEQGNPTAQHLLGLMYDKGHGVRQDGIIAHKWLNLAAARTTKQRYREYFLRLRDAEATKMTQAQIIAAQRLAVDWFPKP